MEVTLHGRFGRRAISRVVEVIDTEHDVAQILNQNLVDEIVKESAYLFRYKHVLINLALLMHNGHRGRFGQLVQKHVEMTESSLDYGRAKIH